MRVNLITLVLVFAAIILVLFGALFYAGLKAFPSKCVGVIHIDGMITAQTSSGIFSDAGTSSDDLQLLIKEAESRDDLAAVLFEINSPGGSVVPSREMYEQIDGMEKPTVAYIRELGASGAYYAALGADKIVAHQDSITGSIGVKMTLQDMSGLFGKLGINETSLVSGDKKDMGENKPLSEEDRKILMEMVDQVFGEYKETVIAKRKIKDRKEIFDGRVFTGKKAYEYGLVDELGSRQKALEIAGEMGGIEGEVRECEIGTKKTFFQKLAGETGGIIKEFLANLAINPSSAKSAIIQYR